MNIVITGCSTGIGWETARYLDEHGMSVYPTVRTRKELSKLKVLGFENAMLLDVRNPKDIKAVIEKVMHKEGSIDVWFNNAGFGQAGALEDISTEVLKAQFETNVFGLHECTIQVLPIMHRQGYGKIIQHSSVLGLISLFGRGAYNASKYAVEGLTDTLRLELVDTNISISLLNTGPIESDFRKNAMQSLRDNVDIENSRFKMRYAKSLDGSSKKVPFKEGALSVAMVVEEIILAKKPKPRYYITKATVLLGYLKRILSTTLLDKILLKVG
jgi:short-subunit dehydrogenase